MCVKQVEKRLECIIAALAIVVLIPPNLFGQEQVKEVAVAFRVGNGALDTAYMDNARQLSEIVSYLKEVQEDTTLILTEVSFCGSASPEGSFLINRRLARERQTSLESYIRMRIPLPDSIVRRCDGVYAWERLAALVENSDMPYRDEAVHVLRNIPETTYDSRGVLIDSRKKHLMDLNYGRSWHYMLKHFFPLVRNASVVFISVRQKPEPLPEPGPEITEVLHSCAVPGLLPITGKSPDKKSETLAQKPDSVVPASEERVPKKPFYMALKTNMLYDALAVPNIGVEFHLGKNWSVAGNWMYAWWDSDKKHRYWRIYGGELAVRKWFGKAAKEKPLTGHHIGVYGQAFTYDFEWKGTGYIGGLPGKSLWNNANYAAGIEYGYSLPVARRLNIDFTLGVGYWGGTYYTYRPLDGHYVWESTRQRHWIGPTKAEISLVWLLGRGNVNDRKGGRK